MSLPVRDFLSDKLPSAHEIKEKLTEAGTWVWEHKKWIIMAACTTGGLVLVVKKRSDIIPKRWSSNYKGIDDLLLSFIERRRITDSIFGRL